MEIEITIDVDGTTTVHVASLLYDLWMDYNLYRREADRVDKKADPLLYKRLVRASVHAFFGYFEGVLNTWIAVLSPETDLEETSFGSKIGIVRGVIQNDKRVPWLDVDRARTIRNTIVHLKPTKSDIGTMASLLNGQFFQDADRFVNWLRLASHSLKMERHPDVEAVLKEFTKLEFVQHANVADGAAVNASRGSWNNLAVQPGERTDPPTSLAQLNGQN